MIVQCKECNSTYDINDGKIPDSGAKVKCNGCENNIEIEKPIAELPELTIEDLSNDSTKVQIDEAADPKMKVDTIKCQYCDGNMSTDTENCPHCKKNIAKKEMTNTNSLAGESFGIFMVFIPLIGAALNWLWVPKMNIYQNPNLIFTLITIGTVIITAVLATVESNKLGFGAQRSDKRKENGPVGWFFFIILLWVIGYPNYLYQRSKKGRKNFVAGGIIVTIAFFLSVISMSVYLTNGFSREATFFGDPNVNLVKESRLTNYPHKTIGRAVEDFMGNPKWQSITGTDGNKYVNVVGAISYDSKKVEAILQFKIDESNDSFEVNALEFNEISQNPFMIRAFLDKMYE